MTSAAAAGVRRRRRSWAPDLRYADPTFRMTFARLCAHYFCHAAWLGETELLDGARRLAGIPGVLVHGRFDLGTPPDVAWLLSRAWPGSELHLVGSGHTGGEEMDALSLSALRRFASTEPSDRRALGLV